MEHVSARLPRKPGSGIYEWGAYMEVPAWRSIIRLGCLEIPGSGIYGKGAYAEVPAWWSTIRLGCLNQHNQSSLQGRTFH
ncbi:hypothetical protein [Lentilactobacillus fungorum]|uniref:hypothetical protein n=1 Tax=Lentilactobacillus fungorum TaxID=2201250 RepID=UPI0019443F65|nr:hypothetical protein [Lentilactobacillus fungorum]